MSVRKLNLYDKDTIHRYPRSENESDGSRRMGQKNFLSATSMQRSQPKLVRCHESLITASFASVLNDRLNSFAVSV